LDLLKNAAVLKPRSRAFAKMVGTATTPHDRPGIQHVAPLTHQTLEGSRTELVDRVRGEPVNRNHHHVTAWLAGATMRTGVTAISKELAGTIGAVPAPSDTTTAPSPNRASTRKLSIHISVPPERAECSESYLPAVI
jgi:hypothetical protein